MKRKVLNILALFFIVNLTLLSKTCDVYVKNVENLAKQHEVNVATAVVMFQIESSCGKSRISKEYNNFYGLKATQDKIKKKEYVKLASGAQVATYKSLDDCFAHYASIMKKHYDSGNNLNKLAKYASDKTYVTKVSRAVKKYKEGKL